MRALQEYRQLLSLSSRRRHTRCLSDWSSDVCSSDLTHGLRGGLSCSRGCWYFRLTGLARCASLRCVYRLGEVPLMAFWIGYRVRDPAGWSGLYRGGLDLGCFRAVPMAFQVGDGDPDQLRCTSEPARSLETRARGSCHDAPAAVQLQLPVPDGAIGPDIPCSDGEAESAHQPIHRGASILVQQVRDHLGICNLALPHAGSQNRSSRPFSCPAGKLSPQSSLVTSQRNRRSDDATYC